MTEDKRKDTTEIYKIKIQGHLDTKWAEWFYGMTITHELGGVTILYGSLPDQIVLHSVLDRLRDMNLSLLSVNLIGLDEQAIDEEHKSVSHDQQSINGTENRMDPN